MHVVFAFQYLCTYIHTYIHVVTLCGVRRYAISIHVYTHLLHKGMDLLPISFHSAIARLPMVHSVL